MSTGKPETRAALLEAARDLIEKRGASDVRLADIARAAGVTRQGLYLHFSSRNALLLALVEYVDRQEELGRHAADVWDAPDAVTALDRFVDLHARYTPRIYPTARVLLDERHADAAVADAWEDRMTGRRRACGRLIDRLTAEGSLASGMGREDAIDMLWALTSIQVWEQLVRDRSWSADRYARHLKSTLRRTFVRET